MFTYFSDIDFENHVTHFYPDFYNDKLIIGKFCQIASGAEMAQLLEQKALWEAMLSHIQ